MTDGFSALQVEALRAVWDAIPEGFRDGEWGAPRGNPSPDQSGPFQRISSRHRALEGSPHITFVTHPGLGNRLRLLGVHFGVLSVDSGALLLKRGEPRVPRFAYSWQRQGGSLTSMRTVFTIPIDESRLTELAAETWGRIDSHARTRIRT